MASQCQRQEMAYECERRGFMPHIDPNEPRILNFVEQHTDEPGRGVNCNANDQEPYFRYAGLFEVWHEFHWPNRFCTTLTELKAALDWLESL